MADRDLIDAVHAALFQALTQPALDEVAALTEADRLCHSLQSQLGGHRYYLPRPDKEPRNLAIAADLRAGISQREAAKKHGVSVGTVHAAKTSVESDSDGFGNPDWNLK